MVRPSGTEPLIRVMIEGEHIDDIGKSYEFIKELGKGSYGQVFRCQNKITGNVYACKKMSKKKIKNKEQFKTEINLLRATDHPNIIKLYDIYEDNKYMYLIMEECNGGEFFDSLAKRAKEKKMYTEKECARIFKQILEAVNYLHAHGVCHRDLKPENILFSNVADDSCLKLIDFGLSKVMDGDNTLKGTVGTTFYMAPEVITGNYNEKCDIWACGIILYIMLCGKPPFYSQDEEELKKKICSMKYDFNHPEFKKVSQDAIELIKKILVPPEKRLSASEILSTPWLKENAPHATGENLKENWENIERYSKLNLVQKSIINFTAFHLTSRETKEFVEMFKSLDENSDGVLSIDEIKKGVEQCKFGNKGDNIVKIFELFLLVELFLLCCSDIKLLITKTLKLFGFSPFLLLIVFMLLMLFILLILGTSFLSESLLSLRVLLFSKDIFLIVLKLKNLSLFFISIFVLLVELSHS